MQDCTKGKTNKKILEKDCISSYFASMEICDCIPVFLYRTRTFNNSIICIVQVKSQPNVRVIKNIYIIGRKTRVKACSGVEIGRSGGVDRSISIFKGM